MRFEYADERMPVAMKMGGATYYLSYDQVGSLRLVADGSGNVVKRISYDSFGNILEDTNPSFTIPFGFAGGLHDRDTGLVRFGYRDYDPEVGRWTAKDPIGFAGGDTDLYGYVLNNPVNLIDSLGLLNIIAGVGGSAVGVTGAEGSLGVVVNTNGGLNNIGFTGPLGIGGGLNISGDVYVGFVTGDISNVSGQTLNTNFVGGPLSVTLISDMNGNVIGGTLGFGPGIPVGASGTYSNIRGSYLSRSGTLSRVSQNHKRHSAIRSMKMRVRQNCGWHI